jgi:hypothetical protein
MKSMRVQISSRQGQMTNIYGQISSREGQITRMGDMRPDDKYEGPD